MAKIRNIFKIEPALGFTEFDILKRYQKSFSCSELGCIHSLFPFSFLAEEMGLNLFIDNRYLDYIFLVAGLSSLKSIMFR